jgi:hypothetical protein
MALALHWLPADTTNLGAKNQKNLLHLFKKWQQRKSCVPMEHESQMCKVYGVTWQ